MSEETSSQPEDTVSRSELTNLQEQLKATRMERDRQIFEKSEIVAKANAYAKERDDLRDSLDGDDRGARPPRRGERRSVDESA